MDNGQRPAEREDDVRWLALLIRRVGILLVSEIESHFDIEPALLTKREREARKRSRADTRRAA